MTAGEHNVAMSMRLYQSVQEMFRRFNPAGVKIAKIVLTPELITVQLESSQALHSLYPYATLQEGGDKAFYEQHDFGCRLVWEAKSE